MIAHLRRPMIATQVPPSVGRCRWATEQTVRDGVPVAVRVRTDPDLDECVSLARVVHEHDGYPTYLPTDLRAFLVSRFALVAWVATNGPEIVGHVALHSRSSAAAMGVASRVTGESAEHFAVVARLLVSPSTRGRGIGRSLVGTAARHAVERDLWPMLDVATHHTAAINLYDTMGWVPVGEVSVPLSDGAALDELVYLGPRAHGATLAG